jgi:heat shock protein HslJ
MEKFVVTLALIIGLTVLSGCADSQAGGGGDLTGQIWVLAELNGKSPVPGSTITAEFTRIGRVAGSAGCNQYNGTYTTDGNTITFSPGMTTTMMMCVQPLMDQEIAYITALSEAKTYSVDGDQLTLFNADGAELAVYQVQSQELSGTSWDVTGYNNGKQAVTSVLAGTTLTADFGADGTLSGNSGCNTFNGTYTVDGSKIAIGPLASTRMACAEPEGVMEQEAQYLAALQTAATYKLEGDRLQLRTADGALAVDLTAK